MRCLLALALALACSVARIAGADDSKDAQKILENVDKVTRKVAKLRGLKQKKAIQRGVMTKPQLKQRLLERVEQEYSAEEVAAEELAGKRFGLLEPDDKLLDMVIALLMDQIAGFYDPWEQQLYLASWNEVGGDMLLAHEIDHALQDQHFDLRSVMKRERDNSDALAARQALVEGDGTALMFEYTMDSMGQSAPWGQDKFIDTLAPSIMKAATGQLDKTPLVLREQLLFPYVRGLAFVAHFLKHHSWKRIDEIYAKPPLSTEHILHPRKYETYEVPDAITAAPLPSLSGYKTAYDNVMGEFGLVILLRQHGVVDERAQLAAMGWGGDRLVVYTPPGHKGKVGGTVGVLYTVWDDVADAIEFYESLSYVMPRLATGKVMTRSDTRVDYEMRGGSIAIAERNGDAVLVVLGAPPARSDDVRAETWKRWQRK